MLVAIFLVVRGFFVVSINVSHFCDLELNRLLPSIKVLNILNSYTELLKTYYNIGRHEAMF